MLGENKILSGVMVLLSIRGEDYKIHEINKTLFSFDQALLGV